MEKSEEYISRPSELSIQALNNLPNDALKKIAYDSDWRTVVNYCKISKKFRSLCSDIWREKTIFEFGKDYWIVRYEDPLRNYLAARVRFLWNEYNRLLSIKFDKYPLPEGYDFRDSLKSPTTKYFKIYPRIKKGIKNMKPSFLMEFAKDIDDFEQGRNKQLSWPDRYSPKIFNILEDYYDPIIKNKEKAINIRKEITKISKLLINHLNSIADETQSFKGDIVYENGIIEEFHLIPGKSVTLTLEDKEKLYEYTSDRLKIYNYGIIIYDDLQTDIGLMGFTEDTNTFYISSRSPLIINKEMERILLEFGIPIFMMSELYPEIYVESISKEVIRNMLIKESG